MNQKPPCPHCAQTVEVPGEIFDSMVTCPHCNGKFNPMQEIMKKGMEWFDRQVSKENATVSHTDYKAAIDACDPFFAAIEPFTKRANHRYNIRHCHRYPPSDAVHKEVAGYTDPEDFEPYTETYLDAHTAAIEALSSAFDNLADAFDALQNDSLYPTYAELLKASSALYELHVSAYSRFSPLRCGPE